MNHRKIFLFALENLGAEIGRYRGIVLLSILLVFVVASVIFLTASLRHALLGALEAEPDFVVQKVTADCLQTLPAHIGDGLIEIAGTTKITPRVYGRYFLEGLQRSVLVMGIDFLDEQSHRELEKIIGTTDMNRFLSDRHAMLTGQSVAGWIQAHGGDKRLRFVSPKGRQITLKEYAVLPKSTTLFSSDMVLTRIDNARKILGMPRNRVSDFAFNAPNEIEWELIRIKAASLGHDLRIVDKKESRKVYEEMFNFSGAFFIGMLVMMLIPFGMILYQRYAQVYATEMRTIGILRATGWSIGNVLELKAVETILLVAAGYLVGVCLAYLYVFAASAPGLTSVFLGAWNLPASYRFDPHIDFFVLASVFLLYALPFGSAVLFPVWRVAASDPVKAMR
jgi:ABC-type lipoprotein release transport system permease subunit